MSKTVSILFRLNHYPIVFPRNHGIFLYSFMMLVSLLILCTTLNVYFFSFFILAFFYGLLADRISKWYLNRVSVSIAIRSF